MRLDRERRDFTSAEKCGKTRSGCPQKESVITFLFARGITNLRDDHKRKVCTAFLRRMFAGLLPGRPDCAFHRSTHTARFIRNISSSAFHFVGHCLYSDTLHPFTMETPTASEGDRYVNDLLGGATNLLSMTSSAASSACSSPAQSPRSLRKAAISRQASAYPEVVVTSPTNDTSGVGGGAPEIPVETTLQIQPATNLLVPPEMAQMMQVMASNQQAVASSQQMMQQLVQCILRTDQGVVKVRGEVAEVSASVDELRDTVVSMQKRINNKEAEAVIDNPAARFVAWCMKKIGINTFDGVSVFWGHGDSVAIYAKALYELIWAGTESTSRKMYGVSKFDHVKYALVALGGREASHSEYDAVYKCSPLSPEPSKSKKRGHCIIMMSATKLRAILNSVQPDMMMCPINIEGVAGKAPNCCSKGVRLRKNGIVWGEEWSLETMKSSGLRKLLALPGDGDKHVGWGGVETRMKMSTFSQLASEKDEEGSSSDSSDSGSEDDDAVPRTMRSSEGKKRRISRSVIAASIAHKRPRQRD